MLPLQRRGIIFVLLGFGFIQLMWYLSGDLRVTRERQALRPSGSPPTPAPFSVYNSDDKDQIPVGDAPPVALPSYRDFALGQAAQVEAHTVCEIGHDTRLGPAFWLENPLVSIFRFGDAFVGETIPPVVNHTRRVRYWADAETSLFHSRFIFHCDLISITNATRLEDSKVVSLVKSLTKWANANVPVVLLGACEDCSNHGRSQVKAWKALESAGLISPMSCRPDTMTEDYCVASLVKTDSLGQMRPSLIPRLDAAVIKVIRGRAALMNGTILLTTVTSGFKSYILNYECSLRRVGLDSILYQPMDQDSVNMVAEINEEYEKHGIARRALASFDPQTVSNLTRIMTWKEAFFISVMRARFAMQAELVLMGFNVFICDGDVSFVRNPMPYFHYNVTVQGQADETDFEELHETKKQIQINGGFYLTMATDDGLLWMSGMKEVWTNGTTYYKEYDDQDAVVDAATHFGCFIQYPNMARYSCPPGRTATFKFLDVANFPTGHLGSTPHKLQTILSKHSPSRPLVGLHANGQQKPTRFRDFGVWFWTGAVSDPSCNEQSSVVTPK